MDYSLEPVLLNSHVVTYHVQIFSDDHFSPQVSYSVILFIPWKYKGKAETL